jgi:putative transposase
VLKAKVHAANVVDREGIEPLLEGARKMFARLSHLWLDAGYRGEHKGRGWVEKVLGWSVDLVQRPRKSAPEEVALRSHGQPSGPKGRRAGGLADAHASTRFPGTASAVGSGTHLFLDRSENRRMSKDYERLTETSEAFIYVTMSRLMVRRLTHS